MTKKHQEMIEFLHLYKREAKLSEQWLQERVTEIETIGEFIPSTAELTFGAKVAWRNSNKCIGRLFWQSLHVFDARDALNAATVFEALLAHIRFATNGGKIRPAITIFHPTRVRILNHQLLRYAGYETSEGVVGDPHSVEITKLCLNLGWQPARTAFDLLPLVIQIDNASPVWMEIPTEDVIEVDIIHPENAEIAALRLKWYAVPIISDMRFSCGGIDFYAAPFNGWYMGTEIGARNLADTNRYNMLPKIAKALSLPMESNATLWKDKALVELNIAVLYSFKKAGVSIVDHHTAAQQFKLFQQQEEQNEREVTGNWTWLIPPLSPATTHIFHQRIENKIIKPNYFYQ